MFAAPETPADRLAALRKAFDAAIRDPELLAEAKKRKIDIEPQDGETLQKLVAEVMNTSPDAIGYARELQGSK
jgi:tripartite-type tricarboxylate transporter receptor subunit TctC